MQSPPIPPSLDNAPPWLTKLFAEQYGIPEEEPLQSTADDLISFMDSSVWYDIRKWCNDSIEVLHRKIEDAKNYPEVTNHLGHIEALRMIILLPKAFLEDLNITKQNAESP